MAGVPLGRVLGTEVRAHWTWVFLLAIITVLFSAGLSSEAGGGWSAILAWTTGAGVATLIFASVTVHELAHVAVARRNGIGRDVVVVQLLGGTYVLEVHARTPGEEARLATAGPIVSAALVVAFGAIALIVGLGPAASESAPAWLQAIEFAAVTLCYFNVFLALVSLVPGYPMDGGRLVHAIAWRRGRDERAATTVVSQIGRLMGTALMILGAAVVLIVDLWLGTTLLIGGWLLTAAGKTLDRRGQLEDLVRGLRVVDAIESESMTLPPQLSLDVFAAEFLGARLGSARLVGRPGELLGLIGTRQVGRVPRRGWPGTRAEAVMVPIRTVPRVSPDMDLWPALELLEQSGLDGLLVDPASDAPSDEPPALLTRQAAARLVRMRVEERAATGRPPAGSAGRGTEDAGRRANADETDGVGDE